MAARRGLRLRRRRRAGRGIGLPADGAARQPARRVEAPVGEGRRRDENGGGERSCEGPGEHGVQAIGGCTTRLRRGGRLSTRRLAGPDEGGPAMAVRYETDGPVAVVTLDRPDVANAIDRPTADELVAAFRRFEGDDSLSVAVLTGAGGKVCAG